MNGIEFTVSCQRVKPIPLPPLSNAILNSPREQTSVFFPAFFVIGFPPNWLYLISMNSPPSFNILTVKSPISALPAEEICGDLLRALTGLDGRVVSESKINEPVPLLFLVVTGGTEQAILRLWKKRNEHFPKEPILLLAHPNDNSLPASLEVLARIQQEQGNGRIASFDPAHPEVLGAELARWMRFHHVRTRLQKAKIGLVGAPSDWLVASMPAPATVRNVWGPEIVTFELDDAVPASLSQDKGNVDQSVRHFLSGASRRSNGLAALSIRCFDLVVGQKATACYALSKLNDEGIVAGCEGDLVSTVGMLWAHYLTEKPVWMANPAQVDEANNSLLLAHCTVPLTMVDGYSVRSHFESGLGLGIQGTFLKSAVTVFRIGGKDLDQLWVAEGETEETAPSDHLCRTQLKLRFSEPGTAASPLRKPLGNHLLLVLGAYADELEEYWVESIK